MAEENQSKYESSEVEIKDRGVFDFLGKKKEEEKPQEVIVTEFDEKVKVSDEPAETKLEEKKQEEGGEKKHSLLEKLHRSGSSSSSSSDEEVEGEDGEKKKKKKEKKKIVEGGEHKHEDTSSVPVEKVEADEEKKGFLEKIKEKLPGQKKTGEEATPTPPSEYGHETSTTTTTTSVGDHEADQGKEKKGILEKIKEKLPGYHSKTDQDHKEKETSAPSH